MPLNLGNLTDEYSNMSAEELWMRATEDEIAMMDSLQQFKDISNAIEIASKAKETSSTECMQFAIELLGTDVSIEELEASFEAATVDSINSLREMVRSTKRVAENYSARIKRLNPGTIVPDPKIFQGIIKKVKLFYPMFEGELPAKLRKPVKRLIDHCESISANRNTRSIAAAMDWFAQALDFADKCLGTDIVKDFIKEGNKAAEERNAPHAMSAYIGLFGDLLRLIKMGIRQVWILATRSKKIGSDSIDKNTKVYLRAGRMGLNQAKQQAGV